MATVFIPAQLRELTGGQRQVEVDARTLRQVVRQLDEQFPGIAAHLVSEDGIASGLQVSIDGALTSRGLLAPVQPTSEIHFLPALGGG